MWAVAREWMLTQLCFLVVLSGAGEVLETI